MLVQLRLTHLHLDTEGSQEAPALSSLLKSIFICFRQDQAQES